MEYLWWYWAGGVHRVVIVCITTCRARQWAMSDCAWWWLLPCLTFYYRCLHLLPVTRPVLFECSWWWGGCSSDGVFLVIPIVCVLCAWKYSCSHYRLLGLFCVYSTNPDCVQAACLEAVLGCSALLEMPADRGSQVGCLLPLPGGYARVRLQAAAGMEADLQCLLTMLPLDLMTWHCAAGKYDGKWEALAGTDDKCVSVKIMEVWYGTDTFHSDGIQYLLTVIQNIVP